MDVFFLHSYCDTVLDPDPQLYEGGGAVWGCAWVLKWAGWWTEGGGGVHGNHFCYWGKLHYHDLQCDSIYIAHNDLLFWEVDGSLQLYAC